MKTLLCLCREDWDHGRMHKNQNDNTDENLQKRNQELPNRKTFYFFTDSGTTAGALGNFQTRKNLVLFLLTPGPRPEHRGARGSNGRWISRRFTPDDAHGTFRNALFTF